MRKLLLPIVAAAACLSCSPPPFNLELSMSALTAGSLTLEGTVGPIEWKVGPAKVVDAVFIPEKGALGGLDLDNGFVLYTAPPSDRQVAFVSWSAVTGKYVKIDNEVLLGDASSSAYPDGLLLALKGAPHFIGMFSFDSGSSAENSFAAAQADPVTGQFPAVLQGPQLLKDLAGVTGNVIGASVYPQPDPAPDSAFWLLKTPSDKFLEGESAIHTSGLQGSLPSRQGTEYSLGGVPPSLTRALYYYDPDPKRAPERSFLSVYDEAGGRWRCWTWGGAGPWQAMELKDVANRLDALLTTGELLSTESSVGRLYSREGLLVAKFPLTGLKLIGERYVGGTARVLFSQLLFYDNGTWFNVYSIPTSDISSLARQ